MNIVFKLEKKDIQKIEAIVNKFKGEISLNEDRYKQLSDEDFWFYIVNQICVIGRATTKSQEKILRSISLEKLSTFKELDAQKNYVNKILSEAKIRYVRDEITSRKTEWIVNNYNNSLIVENGKIILLKNIEKEIKCTNRRKIEQDTRKHLKNTVKGFGMKSASDFLITIGFARTLIAFDVRILNFVNKYLSPNYHISNLSSGIYEALEDSFQVLCERNILPSLFDRIIFQKYDWIKKEIRTR